MVTYYNIILLFFTLSLYRVVAANDMTLFFIDEAYKWLRTTWLGTDNTSASILELLALFNITFSKCGGKEYGNFLSSIYSGIIKSYSPCDESASFKIGIYIYLYQL